MLGHDAISTARGVQIPGDSTLSGVTQYSRFLNMELASCHHSGEWMFEVAPTFLEHLYTLVYWYISTNVTEENVSILTVILFVSQKSVLP
jgi:hypothetical protein